MDFGEAEIILSGKQTLVHLFVVTFRYSNMRFAQAYGGETSECVRHGLRTVFEHIGSVPYRMIFDNATGVGRRVKTKVLETKLFAAFKAHYRSEAKYCNPYSGNEKGNVENAVGFLRRNLMVPLPVATSLEGFNKLLLERCDKLGNKPHWRRKVLIKDLFAQDVQAGLALPGVGFDPVRYESRKADKYGHLQVGSNTYAAGPVFARRTLTVGIRHDVVEILDEQASVLRRFPRVFGVHPETIMEPSGVLALLAHRPGAWANSPVRAVVSDPVRDWLDTAQAEDRGCLLTALDKASEAAGFETAVQAAEQIIEQGDDPGHETLGMLARRLAEGTEPETGDVDLSVYDRLFAAQEGSVLLA